MNNEWLKIVLYRPEIPQNTGNIGRTCVGLNIPLIIVGRPSFSLEDKELKRAGLDYWQYLNLRKYESWETFLEIEKADNILIFTKSGKKSIFEANITEGSYLIFGRETEGLPKDIMEKYKENSIYLPIIGNVRSYNLANTVAVASFEAYRQIKFLKQNFK
ncbi:MAG TPA: tRNA (cytidine(34)-2'-O)-methyltransferase [Spirochaetota bacterium]|nr:tRNA (cytidine(34)-2'-O)-methyltransferase [Spirochaetota bacterium]HOM38178.1 tRNA (cytidine(34)-2'-O)-methyltransferase [Spirochaetota bacterium]HPQ48604.1 tRNA (cytidine(34)-2'-O)-methyltransferase [Spirochaetota bacterium]